MSRHRDIRNMDYSDDYDGYDDVYGHSVDDDYYISPSNRQFIYNRDISTRSSEGDIKEEDESEAQLSDNEKAKLEACLEHVKIALGKISITRNDLVNLIISKNFNVEDAISTILDDPKFKTKEIKEKDEAHQQTSFNIPKSGLTTKKNFNIPNIFNNIPDAKSPKFSIPKLNIKQKGWSKENNGSKEIDGLNDFDNLSDFVSNHLNSPSNCLSKNLQKLRLNEIPDNNHLSQLTENLHISQSVGSVQTKSAPKNDLVIDLSVALKESSSLPNITTNKSRETFEIPYIDCDQSELVKRKPLICNFDSKSILQLKLPNYKKRSIFGRVLCRHYKRSNFMKLDVGFKIRGKIKRFDFKVPSPDDIISRNLRK